MRIVIAGGTGFLGSALARLLRQAGHSVTVLTRKPRGPHQVEWDPYGSPARWVHVLDGAGAVVNLTGASIGQRWTARHKRDMWNSRVVATRTLVAAMRSVSAMPSTLLNSSAVGIYGDRGAETLTEESVPGKGFLASLCQEWEHEALAAEPHARVVLLRSGVALDREGGAMPQMALPFRLFAGGALGSGRQYFAWIHRDDWASMVAWALDNPAVSGPLNVTAPQPVTNRELARALGRALRRPAIMPAPAFAVRAVLGEMASALLGGQRAVPAKAASAGFQFQYPEIGAALREIYAAGRQPA
jgi:uncharacterized protein (TIGR01777 family)